MSHVERVDHVCENCGQQAVLTQTFRAIKDTYTCPACGAWNFLGAFDLDVAELYDAEYFTRGEYFAYTASRDVQHRNFARKLALLQKHGLEGSARVLEIGSATGEFLEVARQAGAAVLGIEPSLFARSAALARDLPSLSHDDPQLKEHVRAFRPTAVVGWDVWEHLRQPAQTFDELLAVSAPTTLVAFSTVDASSTVARVRGARWRQFHPPTHCNYPTRESFRRLFAERDLRVLHHESFGYYRPLVEYIRAITPRSAHHRLPQTGTLWMLPVYLNLYDTQLIIGRRGG